MRIVDRAAFMALPAGTLFAKIPEPIVIRGLHVKGDTITAQDGRAIDWADLDLAQWRSHDTGEWVERFEMLTEGVSFPMEDAYGRDGMFSDGDQFLIYERADLLNLRAIIDAALDIAHPSDAARTAPEKQ